MGHYNLILSLALAACSSDSTDDVDMGEADSGQDEEMGIASGDLGDDGDDSDDVGDPVADMTDEPDISDEPDMAMDAGDLGNMNICPPDVVAAALAAVNAARAQEQTCGNETLGPVGELVAVAELTQAAQGHTDDMAATGDFSLTGSDGSTPRERTEATGWSGQLLNESIAGGNSTAEATVQQLLEGDGTCQNLMAAAADSLGAGCSVRDGEQLSPYWSIVLGRQ